MSVLNFTEGALVNLVILLGFLAICTMLQLWSMTRREVVSAGLYGLLFGGMAIVSMLVPVTAAPGVIFDARSGVMGTAGLLFKPVTVLVATLIACAYRINTGGAGVVPGCLEIILPALIGSVCQVWFKKRGQSLTVARVVLASAIGGFGTNAIVFPIAILMLPEAVTNISLVAKFLILITAPFSMALLSSLIILERKHIAAVNTLADSERRMLHSQKMAAVGALAGKVSHNFVNTLTVVNGSAQFLEENADDPRMVRELAAAINEATRGAGQLVAELLAFSSDGHLEKHPVNLGECVASAESLVHKSIGDGVDLIIDIDEQAGIVNADPDRIAQAVLHMALNAAEAMSGGKGRLTVSVRPVRLTRRERQRLQGGLSADTRRDGSYVLLSVQDNGCGMTPEVAGRMFEPYFTTKTRNRKAGLGLASVYAIIQQHNGLFDVQTAPGQGTTISIYFPAAVESHSV